MPSLVSRVVRGVHRRIVHRWKFVILRASVALRLQPRGYSPLPVAAGQLWHLLATPPGHAPALPWGSAPVHPRDPEDPQYRSAMAHRFRVLRAVAMPFVYADENRERRARMARLADDSLVAPLNAYVPIEWHSDVHTGHRWDPALLYIDVRVAPMPGADIKIPRELSRFNHVGALARGDSARGAIEFVLQVLDWIAANPVGRGVNWACTMDVALRALNWVWGLRLFEPQLARYPKAVQVMRTSLWEHGAYIERNLEYYEELTNNHYLSDIAGLLHIAAAFPEFPESDRWLRFALQELVSEMERETYSDGASHEASTHYHRLVAELFASSAALAERITPQRRLRMAAVDPRQHRVRPPLRSVAEAGLNLGAAGPLLPVRFYQRLRRAADFTAALTKPNGLVPQFGDNDSGRAHKLLGEYAHESDHGHLLALVARLLGDHRTVSGQIDASAESILIADGIAAVCPLPDGTSSGAASRLFPVAGIAVLRAPRAWLAVTCGPNGLKGRGGHGHNDKLSFELNVDGRDFVVDGGCPAYTSEPAVRNRFRATAAHSTIAIDGREQDPIPTGMAGLFRLPQRCEPRLTLGAALNVIGSHDGFGTVHERRFELDDSRLVIDDQFASEAPRTLRFNLDPAVNVEVGSAMLADGASIIFESSGVTLSLKITGATEPRVVDGCFSLGFGVQVATRSLVLRVVDAVVRTEIEWK